MLKNNLGTLYVVATPIGNLQDMTMRAISILKEVDRIAVEDTRHSGTLLKHFSINKPSLALHDFNEEEKIFQLIQSLQNGENIGLISDAGTPLISDPGFKLVQKAKQHGIKVIPIPGACAAIAALCVSGLPTDRFVFEGFLPVKDEARRQRLLEFASEPRTMIFYEAPHRLLDTLATMQEVFGAMHEAVVARELTKIYESVINTTFQKLLQFYTENSLQVRGEIVILIKGVAKDSSQSLLLETEKVLDILLAELPLKQAVTIASKITTRRKNELYEMALKKKKL